MKSEGGADTKAVKEEKEVEAEKFDFYSDIAMLHNTALRKVLWSHVYYQSMGQLDQILDCLNILLDLVLHIRMARYF